MSDGSSKRSAQNPNQQLFGAGDPDPVEWINPDSSSPILLLCEHAGRSIPTSLANLGLPKSALDAHIAWDVGAEALARFVARELDAPLILQRYSRLVIDCNRPPGVASSVPEISDTVVVPANRNLTEDEKEQRVRAIFAPLDLAIHAGFDRWPRRAAISVHSFTRQMSRAPRRPWDAGFLTRSDSSTANHLLSSVQRAAPDLSLAINKPYSIEENGDWFIPHHAEPRDVQHCLIEVCNDQLASADGVALWGRLLSRAIASLPGL